MKTDIASIENGGERRWMILDADKERLLLLRDIFSRFADIRVEYFHSPEEAIAGFEANPEAFEFVITDLEIPETASFELLCRLRSLTPVLDVLMPAGIDLLSNEEAARKGFCRPVRKRLPFQALQQALSPAILKYKETPSGFPRGITLVHAA